MRELLPVQRTSTSGVAKCAAGLAMLVLGVTAFDGSDTLPSPARVMPLASQGAAALQSRVVFEARRQRFEGRALTARRAD